MFANATVGAYQGIPGGAELCMVSTESECRPEFLRTSLAGMPTTRHRFVTGSCEAEGYKRCPDAPYPFRQSCERGAGNAGARGGAAKVSTKPLVFPKSEPGAAYIAVRRGLAVILPDGTAQRVEGIPSADLTIGADGAAYAAVDRGSSHDIFKLDGATATKVGSAKVSFATAFAVGKNGTGHLAENAEVFAFDAKGGRKLPRPTQPDLVKELAYDADGNLVASGHGGVSVLIGDTWKSLEIPKLEAYTEVWLIGHGDQLVVAASRIGYFTLANGTLTQILDTAPPPMNRHPGIAAGILAAYHLERGKASIRLYDRGGATAQSDRTAGYGETVIDGRGRSWYVNSGALIIASLLGEERTEYPIGTLPALITVTSYHDIIVVGGGPAALPPVGERQVVETVTGTIQLGRAPLANATIEICTFALTAFRSSPCDTDRSRIAATTNERGEFSFSKVPLGVYELAFRARGRWNLAGSHKLELDAAKPTHSMGTLRY